MFRAGTLMQRELIRIERRPLKERVGLDPTRRFFTPQELLVNDGLREVAMEFQSRRATDAKARPSKDERAALESQQSLSLFMSFVDQVPLALVPSDDEFLSVSAAIASPGTEDVQHALRDLRSTWGSDSVGGDIASLASIVHESPAYTDTLRKTVELEVFYNDHNPWRWGAIASALSLLMLGMAWLTRWKITYALAGLLIAWCVVEQTLGLGLRIAILDRAPVSNTYEALLWIGLVSIVVGLVAQAINRRSWYLAAAMGASTIALLFAMLVPLSDQTNTLPAVLRSNYWLILHVLTIVASYGAFLLAAVLGHMYFIQKLIARRRPAAGPSRLVVQVYRVMQLGLVLLTVGTILGGVWAADSWGRFWGWDPKETWSLISIIVYFALIHARYVGWLRDAGLAVSAIIGFLAIVWTFYGVNYVMASGLHSYGFGSGGEVYVGAWAIFEIVFVVGALLLTRDRSTPAGSLSNASSIRHVVTT